MITWERAFLVPIEYQHIEGNDIPDGVGEAELVVLTEAPCAQEVFVGRLPDLHGCPTIGGWHPHLRSIQEGRLPANLVIPRGAFLSVRGEPRHP